MRRVQTDEHRMLGIKSSEATFLFRQLLLRMQELHMNPVAGVFLSLGRLGQSSHKFERTLYVPLQCPTYHGDPPLVQGHAARTLSQLDLKVGHTKAPPANLGAHRSCLVRRAIASVPQGIPARPPSGRP